MRKPSWKKSLSARTKGRVTRAIKRALIPGYGKKGMGWLHPKRKLYNTVYKKTTFSLFNLFKQLGLKREITCVPIQKRTSSDFH